MALLAILVLDPIRPAAAQGPAPPTAQASAAGLAAAGKVALSLDEVERRWPSLPTKQQFEILEQLLQQAQFDLAARLLAQPSKVAPVDAAIRRFYVGMVLKGQGRREEAIGVFREILTNNPDFTRVRLELAHTLYANEDDKSARHNFELVLGGLGTQPGLAQAVQSYIAAIDGRRRWDLTTYFSITPSTNLNQGSRNSSVTVFDGQGNPLAFELNKANRQKSGVGIVGGAQASYRQPITADLDLIVAGGGSFKEYKENTFDSALVNASIGPRWRSNWGSIGLYALAERTWLAAEGQAFSWGGLLSTSVRLGAQDMVHMDLTCSQRSFNKDWHNTDLRYQDGHVCAVGGRYDHALSSMSFVRAIGAFGNERTGVSHLNNAFWTLGGGIHNELPLGISLYLQGTYTNRDYSGVFPSTTTPRADERWDIVANLTKRDWVFFGFAPQLQYTFTHNNSNVGIYQYDAHGANLTFTQRF